MVDENFIGMEAYLTKSPGIGGKLKKEVEDFIVEEIPLEFSRKSDGKNLILKIRLKNWETNRFVISLSKELKINRNAITFAGTKDKRAITTQYFCISNYKNDVKLDLKDVEILDQFLSDKCLDLGDLYGNKFNIRIKEIIENSEESIKRILDEMEYKQFPNFFGVQRFGSSRPITHIVGKFILEKKFDEAVRSYIGLTFSFDRDVDARKYFYETLDPEGTIKLMKGKMDYEYIMLKHLCEKPNDYKGAIERLPRTLKMMFIHGYQSYLFNKILSERLKKYSIFEPMVGDIALPVDRFGLPMNDRYIKITSENIDTIRKRILEKKAYISGILFGSESQMSEGNMGEIERSVIEKENINENMFKIKEIREIASKGSRRAISTPFIDLDFYVKNRIADFSFSLFRGSYATSFLREFMKQSEIYYY
ncbi:MAG: tRNA pseudouridine(13) synthase TruD [Thermoplasmata archaeon]|nr:tRNA pseudouridine(13) synthase TruD [Thermoplasmata archaeon]